MNAENFMPNWRKKKKKSVTLENLVREGGSDMDLTSTIGSFTSAHLPLED